MTFFNVTNMTFLNVTCIKILHLQGFQTLTSDDCWPQQNGGSSYYVTHTHTITMIPVSLTLPEMSLQQKTHTIHAHIHTHRADNCIYTIDFSAAVETRNSL